MHKLRPTMFIVTSFRLISLQEFITISAVADPGFSRGGGVNPPGGA